MANVESKQQNQVPYRRVRGLWRTGTLSRSALFTANDHFLLCDYRSGFTERYKRFYFRDIEAIIVRKTMHWIGGMMIWGFIALCFFLIGISVGWNTPLLVIEGICSLFILRHAIRGPSCRTHVQTAVQTDGLPMLTRVRKTNRVLRTLFPLIEQAQGKREETPPEPNMLILSDAPTRAAGVAQTTAEIPLSEEPLAIRHEFSWLHAGTFALVLLVGLNAIWEVNYPSTFSFTILVTIFCMSAVCGIIALVRQARHRVHRGAATMIWLLVISFVMGGAGLDYAFTMASLFTQARERPHGPPPATFTFLTPFQMRNMPGFSAVLWTYGIWSVLVALLGLIFVFMPAPAKTQPPPLPGEDRA